jgi:hypothetical protein
MQVNQTDGTNDEINLIHGIKTESSPFLENILAFVGLYFYNVKILSKSVLWVHRIESFL